MFHGCPGERDQQESLKWILGSVVSSEPHAGAQHPEQDEADGSSPAQ